MPFCRVHLRGQKPFPAVYPRKLTTLGDHLRKRRLDLGQLQKVVARKLGVTVDTVRNWEVNRAAPAVWQWPRIIRFLGYVPFSLDGALPDRLKAYRRTHGLSQGKLARLLGVDESTLWHWEKRKSRPNGNHLPKVQALLAAP